MNEEEKYVSEACDFDEKFSPEMRKAYAEERERERQRNKMYYTKGKGRRIKSYEGDIFAQMVGDCGNAAKTMYRTINDVMAHTRQRHHEKLRAAIKKIQKECPKALYTFLLILKNRENRKESIWAIAQYMKKHGTTLHVNTSTIWRAVKEYSMQ